MKKFFAIVVIAGALTACNNSGSTSETSDSTKTTDTTKMTTPPADTNMSKMSDSGMSKMADTTTKTKVVTDSTKTKKKK